MNKKSKSTKQICIIDLVHNAPTNDLYQRLVNSSLMSIMPQVIGVWCKQLGHHTEYIVYGGLANLMKQLPSTMDVVIINSFTFTAHLAYSLSNMLGAKGIITVLGGPHARCYPEDSCQYFDYVIGMMDKPLLQSLLKECHKNANRGIYLSSDKHPDFISSVEERWEFLEKGFRQNSLLNIVPLISSLGCPFECDFCIDSTIPYQSLDIEQIKNDITFLQKKFKKPKIAWYDPNFGVRFNQIMEAIEEVTQKQRVEFIGECSLSMLSEARVKRMKKNGFISVLPGIESWFGYGNKTNSKETIGLDKVNLISDQLNMVQRHIPYVNTNFIIGLDNDQGAEPFELTKKFLEITPGVFPSFLMLSSFGDSAPANIRYQEEGRIIPIPFHVHRTTHFSNIKPLHYSWPEFYGHIIGLLKHSFTTKAIFQRFQLMNHHIPRWIILAQSLSSGGLGRIKNHIEVLNHMNQDIPFRRFFELETNLVPEYLIHKMKKDLGPELWSWLPEGALNHDPNTFRNSRIKVPIV